MSCVFGTIVKAIFDPDRFDLQTAGIRQRVQPECKGQAKTADDDGREVSTDIHNAD